MQQNKKIDIRWYLGAILVGVISILGLLTSWQLADPEVITFKGDYQTEKLVYNKGEETFYTVNYCKLGDYEVVSISKDFVDGLIFKAESAQALLDTGCRIQEVPLKIPATLPAGKFRLKIVVTYQVSPTKTKTYTHYSNWFEVILNPVTHLDAVQDEVK
jgi:hypothetical protein